MYAQAEATAMQRALRYRELLQGKSNIMEQHFRWVIIEQIAIQSLLILTTIINHKVHGASRGTVVQYKQVIHKGIKGDWSQKRHEDVWQKTECV